MFRIDAGGYSTPAGKPWESILPTVLTNPAVRGHNPGCSQGLRIKLSNGLRAPRKNDLCAGSAVPFSYQVHPSGCAPAHNPLCERQALAIVDRSFSSISRREKAGARDCLPAVVPSSLARFTQPCRKSANRSMACSRLVALISAVMLIFCTAVSLYVGMVPSPFRSWIVSHTN